MNSLRRFIGLCLIATLLAACGGVGSSAYSPVSDYGIGAANAQAPKANATGRNLYVASWGYGLHYSNVKVYAPGSTTALRTISQGISAPSALTFDRSGNLYVANGGVHDGCICGPYTITVYAPGNSSPVRTISRGVDWPVAMSFDHLGNLYVMNLGTGNRKAAITVYGSGSMRLVRSITKGLNVPIALAFDRSDNLYAANNFGNNVTVYAANTASILRTINVQGPTALAFDRSGNLYVGNQRIGPGFSYGPGAINVYAPDSTSVLRTISTGEYGPTNLKFDPSDNLYAVETKLDNAGYSVVNGYAAGGSSLTRTIAENGRSPTTIEFDASGNLYVANCPRECGGLPGTDAVEVYSPSRTSAMRKIDVSGPQALAFGP